MHRIKATLKQYVDENEAQKWAKPEAKHNRHVLAEMKSNANTSNIQTKPLKEEHHSKKRAFSSLKFGGGATLMPVDCAEDIDRYMRYLEGRHKLMPNFLSMQPGGNHVDGRMRQILVDWLIHVQVRFQLTIETLSLTVYILDRSLLLLRGISKQNLQLLGVTCMFIASKFEEIQVPNIEDFVYVAANVFVKGDMLQMEHQVLQALDFDLSQPHSIHFLRRYRFYVSPTQIVWQFAKFISEVALVSYPLAHHQPSVVAAVSLYLASYTFGIKLTSTQLFADVFRMSEAEVIFVARSFVDQVIQFIDSEEKLFALRQKYQRDVLITIDQLSCLREFEDNLL